VNNGLTVEQDPEYAKYFKMLKIGVPMIQVQNKMRADGKDPSLLELDFISFHLLKLLDDWKF